MLQLAKLLVLILLAGSVQGQNAGDVKVMTGGGEWTWEAPYVVTIDTGIAWSKHTPHALHCYNTMDRDSVSAYCTMSYDHRYWDEYVSIDSGVYHTRRLDRWYLDTVQVCDTILGDSQFVKYYTSWSKQNGKKEYTNVWVHEIVYKWYDTTLYAKRVKKTKTEWVIPERE